MNKIRIEEGIVIDISPSHQIDDIQYDRMSILVKNSNGKESVLTLKYKHFDNKFYNVGNRVNCIGELRSHSKKLPNGKNKVDIYVSTSFDQLDDTYFETTDLFPSSVIIDGTVCSKEPLRELNSGKCNIHFILANNFSVDSNGNEVDNSSESAVTRYNSYLPCIAWGKLAKRIDEIPIGTKLLISDGELRSREYIKKTDAGDEIKVCHELYVKSYKVD